MKTSLNEKYFNKIIETFNFLIKSVKTRKVLKISFISCIIITDLFFSLKYLIIQYNTLRASLSPAVTSSYIMD